MCRLLRAAAAAGYSGRRKIFPALSETARTFSAHTLRMRTLRLHYHPGCPRCAVKARVLPRFDWLRRVEFTTEPPRTGPLLPGQIAIEERPTGRIVHGAAAVALLARHVPLYFLLRPLLWLPAFRRWVDRRLGRGR
jgi:hypothetical protein